jgi:hypothetical protein
MLHKIFPDKEKANSIFNMALEREKIFSSLKVTYPTIIAENYYEIIKELSSALLLLKGFKAVGENAHKIIIDNLSEFADFNSYDISLLQDLRIKRNKSQYEGKPFDESYLLNKKSDLLLIIDKLKKLVESNLK